MTRAAAIDRADSGGRAPAPGPALSELEAALGHRFGDRRLLTRALTHRSRAAAHNERLEHLGDSVLGFVITDALYARFPDAAEGDLTNMRAQLVRREALAARARAVNLQRCMRLGDSVAGNIENTGGPGGGTDPTDTTDPIDTIDPGDAILADAVEAVVGAVYLDGGLAAVKRVILGWFAAPLARISPRGIKDAKTRLQEFLQQHGRPLPHYEVVERAGQAHAPVFTVTCAAHGLTAPATATGDSRRAAEQRAAAAALDRLLRDA